MFSMGLNITKYAKEQLAKANCSPNGGLVPTRLSTVLTEYRVLFVKKYV